MQTQRTWHRSHRRGFTLIDLTLTMLILGVVAAVAVPRFSGALNTARLEAAVARITADLRFAQQQAITGGQTVTVAFLTGPDRYEITGVIHPDRQPGNYVVPFSEIDGAVALVSSNFNGTSTCEFDIHGTPRAGSPAVALTTGTITISVGADQRTLTLDPQTGEVTVL